MICRRKCGCERSNSNSPSGAHVTGFASRCCCCAVFSFLHIGIRASLLTLWLSSASDKCTSFVPKQFWHLVSLKILGAKQGQCGGLRDMPTAGSAPSDATADDVTSRSLRPGWQEKRRREQGNRKEDMGDETGMTNKALPLQAGKRVHAAAALHHACNQLTHELTTGDCLSVAQGYGRRVLFAHTPHQKYAPTSNSRPADWLHFAKTVCCGERDTHTLIWKRGSGETVGARVGEDQEQEKGIRRARGWLTCCILMNDLSLLSRYNGADACIVALEKKERHFHRLAVT